MADSQRIQPLASPPSSPVRGTIYVDDSLGLGWYDGTDWQYPGGGGGGGGSVDSVVAGTGIDVDDTDPANPVVSTADVSTMELDGLPFVITGLTAGQVLAKVGSEWNNVDVSSLVDSRYLKFPTQSQPTRAIGTAYQPSSTRPVFVTAFVQLGNTGLSGYQGVIVNCDASDPPTTAVAFDQEYINTVSTSDSLTLSFWAPAGYYYEFVTVNGSPVLGAVTEYEF